MKFHTHYSPPILVFLLLFLIPAHAGAVYISYDYEFDTPTFSYGGFLQINNILAGAGAQVSGTVSFDTNDVSLINPNNDGFDYYNLFTHTGELDGLGFSGLPPRMLTYPTGSTNLARIGSWSIPSSILPGDITYHFDIFFDTGELYAGCRTSNPNGNLCNNSHVYLEALTASNLTLTPSMLIPEPAIFLILFIGMVGIVVQRSVRG
jgi:hypothetical protein